MSPIDDSLQHILERIDAASQRYGRNDQVGLMLAVKTQLRKLLCKPLMPWLLCVPGQWHWDTTEYREMVG